MLPYWLPFPPQEASRWSEPPSWVLLQCMPPWRRPHTELHRVWRRVCVSDTQTPTWRDVDSSTSGDTTSTNANVFPISIHHSGPLGLLRWSGWHRSTSWLVWYAYSCKRYGHIPTCERSMEAFRFKVGTCQSDAPAHYPCSGRNLVVTLEGQSGCMHQPPHSRY